MKLKLLLAASALLMSGCIGLTSEGANYGDQMVADITVYDAETGEVLTPLESYLFNLGTDNVGFGSQFEAKLIGLQQDDELTITEAGPTFGPSFGIPSSFGPIPLEGSIPRIAFESQIGEATVGEEFQPDGAFYPYVVVEVAADSVTYRALPTDGQSNLLPELGANLVTTLADDENMNQELDPIVGSRFTVEPQGDGSTILNLEVGTYEVTGGSLGDVQVAFTPVKPNVIGKDLRYEVTVVALLEGDYEAEPVDGNFGVRSSPVLKGAFNPIADDGHNHVH